MSNSTNVYQQSFHLSKELYNSTYKHNSKVIWLVGLSGSGKSTIANDLSKLLFEDNIKVFALDGDNTRLAINKDLGFTLEDRKENIRRVAEIAKLFMNSGTVAVTSFISPIEEDRNMAREIIGTEDFIEVFIDCPLEVCEKRDVKGLYAKARKGEIQNFTGINSPFEKPLNASIVVDTSLDSIENCVKKIYSEIKIHIHV